VKKFNLSDWALEHRLLVWYFMIVFILAGAFSYISLGREEDPNVTIKTMVIQVQWPGVSPGSGYLRSKLMTEKIMIPARRVRRRGENNLGRL
jgi:Cu/Ag efflux pump CusA